MKPHGSADCFVGEFLGINSISLTNLEILSLFLLQWALGVWIFQWILLFSSWIYGYRAVHSIFLLTYHDMVFLIPDICNFLIFSFFLVHLTRGLSVLLTFFPPRNTHLVLFISSIFFFLFSISLISAFIFIFFLLLAWDLIFFYSQIS